MATATLQTEIEINATPERVWEILTDFAAFPQWNPFIIEMEGKPVIGTRLKARIKPEGGSAMTFTPTVLAATPNREFRWLGRFLIPGLMDGEHRFAIESSGAESVRFIQEETFRGILVSFFLRQMRAGTLAGFEAMNRALKARAEEKI